MNTSFLYVCMGTLEILFIIIIMILYTENYKQAKDKKFRNVQKPQEWASFNKTQRNNVYMIKVSGKTCSFQTTNDQT